MFVSPNVAGGGVVNKECSGSDGGGVGVVPNVEGGVSIPIKADPTYWALPVAIPSLRLTNSDARLMVGSFC